MKSKILFILGIASFSSAVLLAISVGAGNWAAIMLAGAVAGGIAWALAEALGRDLVGAVAVTVVWSLSMVLILATAKSVIGPLAVIGGTFLGVSSAMRKPQMN